MPVDHFLTSSEVAELSGTPKRFVEKAIEERVLAVRMHSAEGARPARLLPSHAVAYAKVVSGLQLNLSVTQKRRLAATLSRLPPGRLSAAKVEIVPAVEVNVRQLLGDTMERTARYRKARDRFIVSDPEILGGTPVIRGTRITVYSALGRVDHGETVADIAADNPDIPPEAIEAAITYARTHPLLGRPSGRPWITAA